MAFATTVGRPKCHPCHVLTKLSSVFQLHLQSRPPGTTGPTLHPALPLRSTSVIPVLPLDKERTSDQAQGLLKADLQYTAQVSPCFGCSFSFVQFGCVNPAKFCQVAVRLIQGDMKRDGLVLCWASCAYTGKYNPQSHLRGSQRGTLYVVSLMKLPNHVWVPTIATLAHIVQGHTDPNYLRHEVDNTNAHGAQRQPTPL
jgi:hypothetical protein